MWTSDSCAFFARQMSGEVPPPSLPQLGLGAVMAANPTQTLHMSKLIPQVDSFARCIERLSNYRLVQSKQDLLGLGETTTGVLVALQNSPYQIYTPQCSHVIANIGVRMMSLAYDSQHPHCGGFLEDRGLSTHLYELILNGSWDSRIAIDFSHMSEKAQLEILEILSLQTLPSLSALASHSGFKGVYQHPRNLSDEVAIRLVEVGGVIGVPAVTFLLDAEQNGIDPFLRHLEYGLKLVGEYSICIGSDACYQPTNLMADETNFRMMQDAIGSSDVTGARYPVHPREMVGPDKLLQAHVRLLAEFGQVVADKVCGLNYRDFLFRTLP